MPFMSEIWVFFHPLQERIRITSAQLYFCYVRYNKYERPWWRNCIITCTCVTNFCMKMWSLVYFSCSRRIQNGYYLQVVIARLASHSILMVRFSDSLSDWSLCHIVTYCALGRDSGNGDFRITIKKIFRYIMKHKEKKDSYGTTLINFKRAGKVEYEIV